MENAEKIAAALLGGHCSIRGPYLNCAGRDNDDRQICCHECGEAACSNRCYNRSRETRFDCTLYRLWRS